MSNLLKSCPILSEMLNSRVTKNQEGCEVFIQTYLSIAYAEALYNTVLQLQPSVTIEVGMAYGVSSLAILTALREVGRDGKLYCIDPFQSTDWQGCGTVAIKYAGLAKYHQLIEDYDYNALPRLLSSGLKVDLAYIDGYHAFDYTLLDWWYVDKMLPIGGGWL